MPGPEPVPEPTPPEPVAEGKVEEPEIEIHHEGLERLMGGPGIDIRPKFGREEPSTDRPATRQPVVPRTHQAVLRVVGVGGAGVNAVNRMVEAQLPGVEFLAINTDLQSLQTSNADVTLHIGGEMTRGLGAGSDPRVGYRAAFDEQDKIKELLKGSDMVFLASGSGGGTGTGAAPVVAKLARDIGALTVAAVTKPFAFEGARRAAQAEEGIAALGKEVDTMIVVPNERLLKILERRTSITDAFRVADDVLRQAVQGISDLVMLPGLINLDFADVRTTMLEAGDAILGIGMGMRRAPGDPGGREGRLLAAARDLGRGRALAASLDHRRPGPLADRGERGRRHRQGGGPPRGEDHLRRQRRRGHERGGLDHRDRDPLRFRLRAPPPAWAAHRAARAATARAGRGAAAGALLRPCRGLARAGPTCATEARTSSTATAAEVADWTDARRSRARSTAASSTCPSSRPRIERARSASGTAANHGFAPWPTGRLRCGQCQPREEWSQRVIR